MACKGLTNFQILNLVKELNIKHFRGVFPRNALPELVRNIEVGIINLDTLGGEGTHWLAYSKRGKERICFDSFGAICPKELQIYLKTPNEFRKNVKCIWRSTGIYQDFSSCICGHLSLYVLVLLQNYGPYSYNEVLKTLQNNAGVRKFLDKIEKFEET